MIQFPNGQKNSKGNNRIYAVMPLAVLGIITNHFSPRKLFFVSSFCHILLFFFVKNGRIKKIYYALKKR